MQPRIINEDYLYGKTFNSFKNGVENKKVVYHHGEKYKLLSFNELQSIKDEKDIIYLENPVYYRIGGDYFVEAFEDVHKTIKFIDEQRKLSIESYTLGGPLSTSDNDIVKLKQQLQHAQQEIADLQKGMKNILSEMKTLKAQLSQQIEGVSQSVRNRNTSGKLF